MMYDGSGWVTVGSAFVANALFDSLAIDYGRQSLRCLHKLWQLCSDGNESDGSSWAAVGSPGITAGGGGSASLAIHSGGPYVAYADNANSSKATLKKYDSMNWVAVGRRWLSAGGTITSLLPLTRAALPMKHTEDSTNGNKITVMRFK